MFFILFLFPGSRNPCRVFTWFTVQCLAGFQDSNPNCCDCTQVCYKWAMHIPCAKLDKMETIKSLKKNNIKLFQFNSPLLMYHGLEPGPLRCLLFYFTIHYPEAACSWRLEQGCGNDNYPIWQLSLIIRVVAIIILVLTPSPLVIYYLA